MGTPSLNDTGNRRYRVRRRRKKPFRLFSILFFFVLMLLVLGLLAAKYGPDIKTRVDILFSQPAPEENTVPVSEDYMWPEQAWYVLLLHRCGSETEALDLAENDRARGAGGYVYQSTAGYSVTAAAYSAREQAARVQGNLLNYHQVETEMEVWSAPRMQIRLTGTQRQVNAMRDSYDFLLSLALQMQQWFVALDEGTQSRQQAENALMSCMETAWKLRENLMQCFVQPWDENGFRPEEHMKDVLLSIHAAMQRALHEESSVRFGAGVKEVHLLCAHHAVRHAQALQGAINSP